MSSSTTTKIIAPAENDNSQGSKNVIDVARKYPKIAKIGSTIPLKTANRNDFLQILVYFCSGMAVASPSGKFCSAIPTANITAERYKLFVATAVPSEKPTARPSGMLCIVIAVKNLTGLVLFLSFLDKIRQKQPKIAINSPPKTNPIAACMYDFSPKIVILLSRAGSKSEKIDAESIIPAERPIAIWFISFEGLLKKKIKVAPSVVIRHGSKKHKIVASSLVIFCFSPKIIICFCLKFCFLLDDSLRLL